MLLTEVPRILVGSPVSENPVYRDCPINPHRPQMGSHKAAKRCDRGFAAPFLVTKAHIDMPFSYLLDSLSETV